MTKRFFSTHEVARMCHVSPGSVIRWIQQGQINASLTAGGHHRISDVALKELLQTLRIPLPEEFLTDTNGGAKLTASKTVLIVDDDEAIRTMLKLFFKKNLPEVRVEEADEGFMAGWKVRGSVPDLVIVDLLLPGIDGFRICQFIRHSPELKHTKILAITGQGEDKRERILKFGADAFLCKPFELSELQKYAVDLLGLQ
ncbi:MAG: response regulator [Candidatus Omnitrophica bacterium]|nr:response regulator [Candidatus Omnitrophota bacterium]